MPSAHAKQLRQGAHAADDYGAQAASGGSGRRRRRVSKDRCRIRRKIGRPEASSAFDQFPSLSRSAAYPFDSFRAGRGPLPGRSGAGTDIHRWRSLTPKNPITDREGPFYPAVTVPPCFQMKWIVDSASLLQSRAPFPDHVPLHRDSDLLSTLRLRGLRRICQPR
jgi:hypothetical protein